MMCMFQLDEDLEPLLADAPSGDYLLEQRGCVRLLWRITEGEPPDGALEPAPCWSLAPPARQPAEAA
jgi:hypothetical protein